MSFLPENYKIPDAKSGYFKLKDGSNRFRILSPALTGYMYWNTANKPVRQKEQFDLIPEDIKLNNDGTYSQIKHFWAFIVWNYDLKMVQILEITQASIQRQLKIKIDNREGKATENDFIVTRSGTGFDTEYDIDVAEASPVPTDAVMALKAKKINLEALYGGGDPFASSGSSGNQAQETASNFQSFGEAAQSSSVGQNEAMPPEKIQKIADELSGKDKARAVAEGIAAKNNVMENQNEPVAPDIAERAAQMENDTYPFDGVNDPF